MPPATSAALTTQAPARGHCRHPALALRPRRSGACSHQHGHPGGRRGRQPAGAAALAAAGRLAGRARRGAAAAGWRGWRGGAGPVQGAGAAAQARVPRAAAAAGHQHTLPPGEWEGRVGALRAVQRPRCREPALPAGARRSRPAACGRVTGVGPRGDPLQGRSASLYTPAACGRAAVASPLRGGLPPSFMHLAHCCCAHPYLPVLTPRTHPAGGCGSEQLPAGPGL